MDTQPLRNALDIINRDIAFAALNSAEIGSVHFYVIGKILLTDTQRLPVAADIRSYDLA